MRWAKSHRDSEAWDAITDRMNMKFSTNEIYNVQCDRMAANSHTLASPSIPDLMVLPSKAIFNFPAHSKDHYKIQ